MTACDPFRIALEQRAHGALPAGAPSESLDAHLSTCSACQAYAAEARAVEAVMGAAAAESMRSVEWSRIEAAVSGWRRRGRVVTFVSLFFALYLFTPFVVGVVRGREVNLPALAFFCALALLFVALAAGNQLRLRREALLAAQGNTAGVLELLRDDLTRRIRAARGLRWALLAYGLAGLAAPLYLDAAPLVLGGAALVTSVFGLGTAYWFFRIYLPRLQRELRALDEAPRG
jgi:hypothetical protein